MEQLQIKGRNPLYGTIPISGAKNAALPLMITSLLTSERLTLTNIPRVGDVHLLARILGNHGVDYAVAGKRLGSDFPEEKTIHLQAEHIVDTRAPYELVSKMRASFWVLGPLLARVGHARVSLPGGCAIGTRPVDLLLLVLEKMGARIELVGGDVCAEAKDGLKGAEIIFPKVTIGGTHTAVMASTLAHGRTCIHNAAREPEIVDVAKCLIKMGARIEGAGTSTIEIEGVGRLGGTQYRVMPDRIEAGTYACAAASAGGDIFLEGTEASAWEIPLSVLRQMGIQVEVQDKGIRVKRRESEILQPADIRTAPFPGFATDLQAQFMALMCLAQGTSHVTENIFENRFMHVQELARLGARIRLDGQHAIVAGGAQLKGAPVMATDLRASVSLVIAGLAAEGTTIVNRLYHLDRGFENLEEKLNGCGANIQRVVI